MEWQDDLGWDYGKGLFAVRRNKQAECGPQAEADFDPSHLTLTRFVGDSGSVYGLTRQQELIERGSVFGRSHAWLVLHRLKYRTDLFRTPWGWKETQTILFVGDHDLHVYGDPIVVGVSWYDYHWYPSYVRLNTYVQNENLYVLTP